MKVLQIGYGKMGTYICNTLKQNDDVTEIVVYDKKFEQEEVQEGKVKFINKSELVGYDNIDCAFVATPVVTHYEIIQTLLDRGICRIYVEKPALVSEREHRHIARKKGGPEIICGYILRQSEPMFALKRIVDTMFKEGYKMDLCSVVYQKNLPAGSEPRTLTDIGVFEEIVHVWDLLFNYLQFSQADSKILENIQEVDPGRDDRIIYANFLYQLNFKGKTDVIPKPFTSIVNITSSFRAKEQKREFYFHFRDDDGNRRHVYLSFDNADGYDHLIVNDATGKVLYHEEYPSLEKLQNQTNKVINYFKSGYIDDLATIVDSEYVTDGMELLALADKVIKPKGNTKKALSLNKVLENWSKK